LLGRIERREELGVASYKFVLHEEAIIKWLLICEVLAQQEEVLEVVPDDFQAG